MEKTGEVYTWDLSIPKGLFTMKKFAKSAPFIAVAFVIIAGLLLRLKLVLANALWLDEAIYYNISQAPLQIIFSISHSIKDNPPLFFAFLQLWSTVSSSVIWLRLTGMLPYLVSCYLIYRLFEKTGSVRLLILLFFSFSPFFINLNSWISPYNLLLVISLAQILLVQNYLQGKFKGNKLRFIIMFTGGNFLAFNIHYSAFYLYVGYAAILIYFLFFRKKLVKTFFFSLLFSTLTIMPNILFIFKNFGYISRLLPNEFPLEFSSPLNLFYYINRIAAGSVIRDERTIMRIIEVVGLFVVIEFKAFRNIIRNYNLIFFLAFFVAPIISMFFIKSAGFEILFERNFAVLHIGFYFLIVWILVFFRKVNKSLFVVFFAYFVVIAGLFSWKFMSGKSSEKLHIPGNVLTTPYLRNKDYQSFLGELGKKLEKKNYDTLLVLGMKERGNQGTIFLDYYLPQSNLIKGVLKGRVKKLLVVNYSDEDERVICNYLSRGGQYLIVDFAVNDKTPECFKNAEVLEFWNFFKK